MSGVLMPFMYLYQTLFKIENTPISIYARQKVKKLENIDDLNTFGNNKMPYYF